MKTETKMTGTFWTHYQRIVEENVIPYQWKALNDELDDTEPSHAIDNFKIAAGEKTGEHYGMVFQDSDVYKWLESVAYSLGNHANPALEKQADETIELIGRAQLDDGYVDTYYQVKLGVENRWTNLRDNHEMYCAGHMIEAAVAYFEITGKSRFLEIAEKFASYIDSVFGLEEGKIKGYPGHEEIELSLVRLYLTTGKEKYLNLATYFVNERGQEPLYFDIELQQSGRKIQKNEKGNSEYSQSHLPIRNQKEAVGHAVRAVYFYAAASEVARLNNDDELKKALELLWGNVVNHKMSINAGIGASAAWESFSFDDDLPNDTTYNETCASIGLAFWAYRMLKLEPNGEYADVLENAIYNGSLCGMDLQGKRFLYVNPLQVDGPNATQREDHRHVTPNRQKWFNCACCPPNLARLIGSVGDYVVTEFNQGVYVNLYGDSISKVSLNGKRITLVQKTKYPWEGKVLITVQIDNKKAAGKIAVRKPKWSSKNFELTINGIVADSYEQNGFVLMNRTWNDGDIIAIQLDMTPKKVYSNTRITENIGKVAVTRGPLVYVAEERDNGNMIGNLWLGDSAISSVLNEELLPNAVYLKVQGKRSISFNDDAYSELLPTKKDVNISLLPYFMWGNRGYGEFRVWLNY